MPTNKFPLGVVQGGRSIPVSTPSAMGPRTRPQQHIFGGGCGVGEKRIKAELDRMSPEERHEYFKKQMEVRPDPVSGPPAQTSLRDSFEAGEATARNNSPASGDLGDGNMMYPPYGTERQPELRNFRRASLAKATEASGKHASEKASEGTGKA